MIAQWIPAFTGAMIFISVLIANRNDPRKRRLAWLLGLVSQLMLIAFGLLTKNYAFSSHVLVAGAFAFNLIWKPKAKADEVRLEE